MPENKTYQYFAFISFQSADAKEAVRLQHAIESYRLPAVLCKVQKVPQRIKPLYCYINDMHAGEELMQELKSRMENSRYLIVVCSPNAAKSVYVNSGIDYFVSLGRRDSIIPVIVDGVPYSGNPETECFPEALRRHFPKAPDPLKDHSILGINIREAGVSRIKAYDRAMLMVVARMLQLDFDGLLLRDRQRRRRRTLIGLLLSLIILTTLGLTWFFSQTVDVNIQVEEATPHNEDLPPCTNIVLRLYLDKELKTDTIGALGETAVLHHIPPRYIGREVHVTLSAKDYLPTDTTVVLQREMRLPIRRDADIYGHIRFRVIGKQQVLRIAGCNVSPDTDALVELSLPIEEQRTSYPVEWPDGRDTLFMPCGEDDVIELL